MDKQAVEASDCKLGHAGCHCLTQPGCNCQRFGKSGVPFPSGKCMICGHMVDWNGWLRGRWKLIRDSSGSGEAMR